MEANDDAHCQPPSTAAGRDPGAPDQRRQLRAGAARCADLDGHQAELAALRHAGPAAALHHRLQVLADVRRADRLPQLQRHRRHHRQSLGGVGELRALRELLQLLADHQEHAGAECLQPGRRVPVPDHPGPGAELRRPRLVPAHGADGRLRAVLHLDGGHGRHHPGHARPALRSREPAPGVGRVRAGRLHGQRRATSATSTSGRASGSTSASVASSTWPP